MVQTHEYYKRQRLSKWIEKQDLGYAVYKKCIKVKDTGAQK